MPIVQMMATLSVVVILAAIGGGAFYVGKILKRSSPPEVAKSEPTTIQESPPVLAEEKEALSPQAPPSAEPNDAPTEGQRAQEPSGPVAEPIQPDSPSTDALPIEEEPSRERDAAGNNDQTKGTIERTEEEATAAPEGPSQEAKTVLQTAEVKPAVVKKRSKQIPSAEELGIHVTRRNAPAEAPEKLDLQYDFVLGSDHLYSVSVEGSQDGQEFRRRGTIHLSVDVRNEGIPKPPEIGPSLGILVSSEGHVLVPARWIPAEVRIYFSGDEAPVESKVIAYHEGLRMALVKVSRPKGAPFTAKASRAEAGAAQVIKWMREEGSKEIDPFLSACELVKSTEESVGSRLRIKVEPHTQLVGIPIVDKAGRWVGIGNERASTQTAQREFDCVSADAISEWLATQGVTLAVDEADLPEGNAIPGQWKSSCAFALIVGRANPDKPEEVAEVHVFSQWEENDPSSGVPPREIARTLVKVDRSSGQRVDQFGDIHLERVIDQPGIGPIVSWVIEPLDHSNYRSWTSTQIFHTRALPEWHAADDPLYLLLGEESVERITMKPEPEHQWRLPLRVCSASRIESVTEDSIEIKRVFRVEFVTPMAKVFLLSSGEAEAVFDRKRGILAQNNIRYDVRLKGPDGPSTPVHIRLKREQSAPN